MSSSSEAARVGGLVVGGERLQRALRLGCRLRHLGVGAPRGAFASRLLTLCTAQRCPSACGQASANRSREAGCPVGDDHLPAGSPRAVTSRAKPRASRRRSRARRAAVVQHLAALGALSPSHRSRLTASSSSPHRRGHARTHRWRGRAARSKPETSFQPRGRSTCRRVHRPSRR